HRLGHVGAAGRAFLHEREDLGGIDRYPELGETLANSVDSAPALFTLLAEERLKPLRVPVEAIAEDVDLGARHVAVDLETRNDLERRERARLVHRVRKPARRVVVGDGEDADAVLRRQPYELTRRQRAVGRGRVRVEVDRA